jgi:hypothetical protein
MLVAGDTLLVQGGHYDMIWNWWDLNGLPYDWIVIKAEGDVVIDGNAYNNVINIYDGQYVRFEGFDITNSYSGSGIDGIKFRTASSRIVLEDLHIYDVTGVGISANVAGEAFTHLTIRYCHIHDITDVGEGLYLGNQDGLTTLHHCLVEFNWIHDCHPRKGIQLKRGTNLNVIQDNVVYNCDEAGIVLYRTDRQGSEYNNLIRRNVIWNAPEGIFAVGQTNIDNNVVFDCDYGINVRDYNGWGMEDLYIRNNIIYCCATTCLRLDDWNNATGEMVCINNACFQDSIAHSAIQMPDGIGPGYVAYNRHYGQSQTGGSTLGNPPSQEFINATIVPGVIDLYPLVSGTLIDSGTSGYGVPTNDFNWRYRPFNTQWDIGAYEWSQSTNPGWQIQLGFKQIITGINEVQTAAYNTESIVVLNQKGTVIFQKCMKDDILIIHDITGRELYRSGKIDNQSFAWNAQYCPSGVYFYRIINQRNTRSVGKFVLIN